MVQRRLPGELHRTPFKPQQRAGLPIHLGLQPDGVGALLGAFAGEVVGLFGSVASIPSSATQLAADRGLVASRQSGNLHVVVLGSHTAANLLSFNVAEVFVIHRAASAYRSGILEYLTF